MNKPFQHLRTLHEKSTAKVTMEELRLMGCPDELLIQYYLSPELIPDSSLQELARIKELGGEK